VYPSCYEFIINGGYTSNGKSLISNKGLQKYTCSHGYSKDKTTKAYLSVDQDFLIGTLLPSFYGWRNSKHCFSHADLFSSPVFGNDDSRISAAIITNGNRSIGDFMRRFIPLSQNIRRLK